MRYHKKAGDMIFSVLNGLLMIILMILALYPIYYAVINSFNSSEAILRGFSMMWPADPTADSWKTVFGDSALWRAFLVTVVRTIVVTLFSLLITSMFAYAWSRPYLRGKKFYTVIGFVSMYFSGGIIPFFLLINGLGLYNSFWIYILPSLFGGFYNVIIYNTNFKALPASLFESAKLDGAGEINIFTRIVIPLSKPVLAAMCVFSAVGIWNDYTTSLYYTNSQDLQTLQYYILKLVRSYNAAEQLQSSAAASGAAAMNQLAAMKNGSGTVNAKTIELAAMVISAIPMIVLYPFAQKFFVKGLLVGSIKE